MKSHLQPRSSGSGDGVRSAMSGVMPYISERQIQAYLMARDTIRRVQRASPIFDSISKDEARLPQSADVRLNCH
jgi:hypothetical protein